MVTSSVSPKMAGVSPLLCRGEASICSYDKDEI